MLTHTQYTTFVKEVDVVNSRISLLEPHASLVVLLVLIKFVKYILLEFSEYFNAPALRCWVIKQNELKCNFLKTT